MFNPYYAARTREFWERWKNQIRWVICLAGIVLYFYTLYRLGVLLQNRVDTPAVFVSYCIFLAVVYGLFFVIGRFVGHILRLPQDKRWKAGLALALSIVFFSLSITASDLNNLIPMAEKLTPAGFWKGWVKAFDFLLRSLLIIPIVGSVYYGILNIPMRDYWVRYQFTPLVGITGLLLLIQGLFIESWALPQWTTRLVVGPFYFYLFVVPLFYYFAHRELIWMQEQIQMPINKWAMAGIVLLMILLLPNSFRNEDRNRYEWKTIYYDTPRTYPAALDKTFEEYIVLPEENVSIAHAAILAAKEIDPTVDIEACLRNFDQLAKEIHAVLNFRENPQVSISKMQARIFQPIQIYTNSSWLSYLRKYGLHVYNDSGFCMAGTLLHLGVAERVGLNVQQIMLYSAEHTLLYYNDPYRSFYFEGNGPNAFYDRLSQRHQERCQEAQYRHLDRSQTFAAILGQLSHCSQNPIQFIARSAALNSDSPYTMISLASYLSDCGDKKEALCKLDQVLEAIPDFYPALQNKINYILGDPKQNFDTYMSKLVSIENNTDLYGLWGAVAEGQGNKKAAAERYRKSLWLSPNNIKAAVPLGRILYDQGKVDECLKVLERCSEADQNPEALHLMSIALQKKAIQKCQESLRLNPFFLPPFYELLLDLPPGEKADQCKVPYKRLGVSLWVYWNYFLPLSPFMHGEKTEENCVE